MSGIVNLLLRLYKYKYILECAVLLSLFAAVLPKKKGAGIFAAIILALALGLSSYWNRDLADNLLIRISRYFLLTGTLFAGAFAVFDVQPFFAVYATVSVLALQHVAASLHTLLTLLLGLEAYSLSWMTAAFLCFLFIAAGAYFLFIRSFHTLDIGRMDDMHLFYIGGGIVIMVLVLSLIPQDGFSFTARLITCLYDMIGCAFGLALLYAEFHTGKLEKEVITLQELIQKEERQRAMRSENMELVNIKCHDIKKQLSNLGGRIGDRELKDLEDLVEIYDSSYKTGNNTLDVILAEKSLYCGQHGITLTCIAEGGKLGFMTASDIYSIFGNAIDNAVAAVETLPRDKRIISLTVRENFGLLSVHIENYFDGQMSFMDGLPETTKGDRDYHGFGMRSIAYTTKKYEGTCTVKAEDGLFSLDILLPLPD